MQRVPAYIFFIQVRQSPGERGTWSMWGHSSCSVRRKREIGTTDELDLLFTQIATELVPLWVHLGGLQLQGTFGTPEGLLSLYSLIRPSTSSMQQDQNSPWGTKWEHACELQRRAPGTLLGSDCLEGTEESGQDIDMSILDCPRIICQRCMHLRNRHFWLNI